MSEIEKIVEEVDSSMSMEGLPLTADDKARIRTCLNNPAMLDEILSSLLKKHTMSNVQEMTHVQRL